jgi:long-chain acyl-CoA synthetase
LPPVSAAPHRWENAYPAGVDYHAALTPRPLAQIFDDAANRFTDRPAFDFLGRKYSYRQLQQLIDHAAAGFQRLGVGKGTHVGLIMPNCPYYPIAYFAVLKAGGTVVNFNPLYTAREIAAQVRDSRATMMVTLDLKMVCDKLAEVLAETGLKTIIVGRMQDMLPFPKSRLYRLFKKADIAAMPAGPHYTTFQALLAPGAPLTQVVIDPLTDIALLQYTGGTTGVPKGAMLTHANVAANTVQATLWFEGVRYGQEKMLAVIPFFHVFALTAVMMMGFNIGAEIIALPRFELVPVLKTIAKKKPTIFPAVPTIYTAINHYPRQSQYDLSSIRFCISGGAPLPAEVRESFERLTGCRLVEGYGLSETAPIASCNPVSSGGKAGSIGLPMPGTLIEIVSLEDRTTPLPEGEKGEICISGPQVMAGYWHQPEETATAMQGSRFHTGDIGYMDEDGYTFIVDRLKDIIIAGGFKIYPRHIEEALYQHPGVEECIAAGLPDTYRGQTVKVWIKRREGSNISEAILKDFLKAQLSAIEIPKLFEIRDTPLPKTLIGKLSRKAVLEEEAKRLTSQNDQFIMMLCYICRPPRLKPIS